ncbi:TPA: hypothetical protein JG832_002517 [Enterobacter hormaechei subsp. xiangfangensis]|nr:hypothetical protein [Enterobacter hormaechei subsp. xiangfangensis]HAV1890652.1 hypothetical protein [Enterobacter hormaechei subsp. xiangfangensis]
MPDKNPDYNHTNHLLFRFRERGLEPTGRREVTGLRDIDHALANLLATALKGLMVSEETLHNRAFARFAARPPRDQVLVGHFDDLRDMVRSIRQAKAGRPSQHGNPFANPDALPIINITRTLDLSYGYTERQLDRQDFAELQDTTTGETRFLLSTLPVTLTYNLTIASADKEPLAMLCNLLAGHFYALHSTSFEAVTRLAGADIELECALNNMKGTMISDVSLPVSEERLFAGQMTIEVIADTMIAHEVKQVARRYQVGIKAMDETRPFPNKDA